MSPLADLDRGQLRVALAELGADGWLLYDFHGVNPVPGRVLGLGGMGTRRLFVYLPREGEPIAVAHKIELQPLADFPGRILPYARWEELHAALGSVVKGRTVAMEISHDDAVPYVDRVPYGVIELVRRLGGTVVSSAALVSGFAARWSAAELADHLVAAEILAQVAREHLARAVCATGSGLTESALQGQVIESLKAGGLVLNDPPIVAFGPNTANPHYEPLPGRDAALKSGDVVLLDLWAGRRPGTVFADQTWMGYAGDRPPPRVDLVWRTVRDARDAALQLLRTAAVAGRQLAGYEVDGAARGVIEAAGFGEAFVHRTGHSIDKDLHGSGPHLDGYETRDERKLVPGVGFSVEPGVYLPGEFGVRSEVNVYCGENGPRVTPDRPQTDLILAG